MQLNILLFGIARDIMGGRSLEYKVAPEAKVSDLLQSLQKDYPKLEGLASLKIAVNNEYVENDYVLQPTDEVVVIPPVSGG